LGDTRVSVVEKAVRAIYAQPQSSMRRAGHQPLSDFAFHVLVVGIYEMAARVALDTVSQNKETTPTQEAAGAAANG